MVFIDNAVNAIRSKVVDGAGLSGYAIHVSPKSAMAELIIPKSGTVKLSLMDCRGAEVAIVADDYMTAGTHKVGLSSNGSGKLASGAYIAALYSKDLGNQKLVSACGGVMVGR